MPELNEDVSTESKINVVVISNQQDLIDAIVSGSLLSFNLSFSPSYTKELYQAGTLSTSKIVIYDLDSVDNDIARGKQDLLSITEHDPSKLIILIGGNEVLTEFLTSDIKSIIFRVLKKPLRYNQMLLAFKSAIDSCSDTGAAHSENIFASDEVARPSSESKKKISPIIFAVIALLIIVPLGFFFMSGDKEESQPLAIDSAASLDAYLKKEEEEGKLVRETIRLNQLASTAKLEGRITEPVADNALYYYEEVLNLNSLDITASEGRAEIINGIYDSFDESLAAEKFDESLNTINSLAGIDPVGLQDRGLYGQLETAISNNIEQLQQEGDAQKITELAGILEKLGGSLPDLEKALNDIKQENTLLNSIDKAIAAGNLIPPASDNAYTQVTEALKNNTVNPKRITSRKDRLSLAIMKGAVADIKSAKLDTAAEKLELVEELDTDRQAIDKLAKLISDKRSELAKRKAAEKEKKQKAADSVKKVEAQQQQKVVEILPAKIINRVNPRYPKRALEKNIQGWVNVSFIVKTDGSVRDVEVVDAKPRTVFNNSAISAVRKWKFSPATNKATGEAVEYPIKSLKLSFKLSN